jgi:DNA polymerase-3 subunit delta'
MARDVDATLPGAGEGVKALSPALAARFDGVRARLEALAGSPPQVLLLEGATADERYAVALWWAARLNCREASAPCLACPACVQVTGGMHRDVFLFDGREGNISIDSVREVRSILGEPPRGDGYRVIVFAEAQSLGEAAANALLKSLEEPRPGTSFLLLAPQRERLLPTLVSRGWVLTLPWPRPMDAPAEAVAPWLEALAAFCGSGRGWFEKTGVRGAVDADLATAVVLACERALLAALSGEADAGGGGHAPSPMATHPLTAFFSRLGPEGMAQVDALLAHCSESLALRPSPVTPPMVLDWLAAHLFGLARSQRKPPAAAR